MTDANLHNQNPWYSRVRTWLDVVATLAMIVAAGTLLWRTLGTSPQTGAAANAPAVEVPKEPLALDGLNLLGDPSAQVVLLIFSDFQCPFCARFNSDTMPTLKKRFVDTGQVRLAFRHLPLPIHDRAQAAAEGAECAARQQKFWPMHDALFAPPMRLNDRDIRANAEAVAIDLAAFAKCVDGAAAERVREDTKLAQRLGLTGTPSFVVGRAKGDGPLQATELIIGARPADDFVAALERAVKGRS
jgi:protein-disulfide isomerase